DVNASLAQIEQFLRPTLGEDVTVTLNLTDRPTPVLTDGSYLESSIMNLAANARDAMPEGGRLTIETSVLELTERDTKQYANLKPGRYVQIAVSDTGSGISAEHLHRVFDPFYTTKEAGNGTGLGLSMVYGFARESGGQVTIYSEEGIGTTVRLYLPYAGRLESSHAEESDPDLPSGGTEAILVVEDDELVRNYVCTQLSSLGYRVIEARNAAEALEIVESPTHIDLVFTDVVMPEGMSGPDLAECARARRPTLKILFTTGHADHAAVARLGAKGAKVINKPYRLNTLAFAIREEIDSGPEEGAHE
ncbi:MAG: response regulator, partial [Alphaproteobacteria bacterium]|nr:response regulator [Alphaproteobacteria bacterium]